MGSYNTNGNKIVRHRYKIKSDQKIEKVLKALQEVLHITKEDRDNIIAKTPASKKKLCKKKNYKSHIVRLRVN